VKYYTVEALCGLVIA